MPLTLRPIRREDNPRIAQLIRTVLPEFGGVGPGYAVADSEVDSMYETYNRPRSAYVVAEWDGIVQAGAGFAPLKGGEESVCELQKMYIFQEARGQGIGKLLMRWCLDGALKQGFTICYLETLAHMEAARALYKVFGFTPLAGPMGDTGHYKCNSWYIKALSSAQNG